MLYQRRKIQISSTFSTIAREKLTCNLCSVGLISMGPNFSMSKSTPSPSLSSESLTTGLKLKEKRKVVLRALFSKFYDETCVCMFMCVCVPPLSMSNFTFRTLRSFYSFFMKFFCFLVEDTCNLYHSYSLLAIFVLIYLINYF